MDYPELGLSALSGGLRVEVAHHEAGHAVMAYTLRHRLLEVSIADVGERWGHSRSKTRRRVNLYDQPSVQETVQVILAGPAADLLLAASETDVNLTSAEYLSDLIDQGDDHWNDALRAAFIVAPFSESERRAFIVWLWERSRNLLALPSNWTAVTQLATALDAQDRLTGKEAEAIIRQAQVAARASAPLTSDVLATEPGEVDRVRI